MLSLLFFISCTREQLSDFPLPQNDNFGDKYRICRQEALENLNRTLSLIGEDLTKSGNREIANIYAIPSSQITTKPTETTLPDTLLYAVNFMGNQGYAILAADRRIPDPVIAVIDNGHYEEKTVDNSTIADEIITSYATRSRFADTLITGEIEPGRNNPPKPEYYIQTEVQLIWKTTPMVMSLWGQWAPFNNFRSDGAPVGCVALAAAQIFAYHAYPNLIYDHVINWKLIKSERGPYFTSKLHEHLSSLLYYVSKPMSLQYNINGTSGNADNAKMFFNVIFTGTNIHYGYNESTVKYMLQKKSPIYIECMRGLFASGHAWVIDGGFTEKHTTRMYEKGTNKYSGGGSITRTFIHCNWGWNGTKNGYYVSGVFEYEYNPKGYEDGIDPGTIVENDEYKSYAWDFRLITYDNPK